MKPMTPEQRAIVLELLEDIYRGHRDQADHDSDWTLQPDTTYRDEPCAWCDSAKPIIDALRAASPDLTATAEGS